MIIVVDGISLMLDFMNYYAFVSFIVFKFLVAISRYFVIVLAGKFRECSNG